MGIAFVKLIHYSVILKAGGRLREFNFRKLRRAVEDKQYQVDVSDDRGERIIFNLSPEAGISTIPQFATPPNWVQEKAANMLDIIETYIPPKDTDEDYEVYYRLGDSFD